MEVFTIFERTIFESKSQHTFGVHKSECEYLQYSKEQYLKANHNSWHTVIEFILVFTIFERTIFESKSQQSVLDGYTTEEYLQYSKEQYLKANHNLF